MTTAAGAEGTAVPSPASTDTTARGRYPVLLYAGTTFLSAFLLFQVQPLIGKYILPWFGGGSTVWTTTMLFFQVALLGGYAYAHFVSDRLSPRRQGLVHLVLLILAIAALPIIPREALRPGDLLIITSDHGCDPTTPSTDHSREHALLLAYAAGRNAKGAVHEGEFGDVGATVNAWLGGKTPGRGIPGTPILEP